MVSLLRYLFDDIHSAILYDIINIICQTFLYVIHLCLFPITLHAMVTNGLQSRARKCLLAIITSVFALMTVYWIFSVVYTFLTVDSFNNALTVCYGSDNAYVCILHELYGTHHELPASIWLGVFADIVLVNFIIADGVVVWRAWVLCSDQSKVILVIPVVMLAINTVIYLMKLVARAIFIFSKDIRVLVYFDQIINITQMVHTTLSLIINIYATSIIALKAWKYRKLLIESGLGVRTPRQAIKILALLVESGVVYILIGATRLICIPIFLHFKLNGLVSTFLLVGVQLVGIYPISVVLLVEKNRSLSATYCSFGTMIDVREDRPSQAEGITFAPGPVLASGEEMDSVTRTNRDAGLNSGSSKVLNEEPPFVNAARV